MIDNYINEELSFIERKMLFREAFKDKLTKLDCYEKYEEAFIIYKILFFNKFEDAIPIHREEVYRKINLDSIIDEIKSVLGSAFYIKYKETDIYFTFEDRNNKINIKCTNKIINNTKQYDYIGFVNDIEAIINDFANSIQGQIDRLFQINDLLNKNIKLLNDML